jgi:hypothetical protein
MGTRTKLLATLAVAGACGALAPPSMAGVASTGVTLHLDRVGTFRGSVVSNKPHRCGDGRKVKLYRQKGTEQHPNRDIKVGESQAQNAGHHRFKWALIPSRPRAGDFYARVLATGYCQGDISTTLHVSRRPNTKITDMSVTHGRNVTFEYRGSHGVPPYNFQCKLDDKPYRHCPDLERRYVGLSHGHHVFRVRARGDNGKTDRTPDRREFRI